MKALAAQTAHKIVIALAAAFFAVVTWTSWARWANFEYRTFDLAYYVQAIWQLIHGRFEVSVEHVPLLGNHVEPIVFLFVPLFALFRHPMLFVFVQNALLATMAPVGYRMARRLGCDPLRSLLIGALLLLTPAAGYMALHEFHPEALTAPFLLLLLDARLARSLGRHWLWFAAVLACKENMALLLAAYCVVNLIVERARGWAELRRWYLWPLLVALVWFVLCSKVITPTFNSGSIDYVTLYDRLGNSGGEILRRAITQPQLFGRALLQSLTHGNLVWALLLPFLGLPLLRPRWLVMATPILLQHLLSWRSSEWNIYFHYAAPLLPLFWMAMVEAIAPRKTSSDVSSGLEGHAPPSPINGSRRRGALQVNYLPWLLIAACVVAQAWLGPAGTISSEATSYLSKRSERERKNSFIAQIPARASVVAPLPYLSHLAMREKLYSLHYILKGLKTLSHASYEPPPPTDYVLIDYNDDATFDAGAGYYHPAMQTKDGRVIPSSDRLLHEFLKQAYWTTDEQNERCLFHNDPLAASTIGSGAIFAGDQAFQLTDGSQLFGMAQTGDGLSRGQELNVQIMWKLAEERTVFPWMLLRISKKGRPIITFTKGLCAPEAFHRITTEQWHLTSWNGLPAGTYSMEALFIDNAKRVWMQANGQVELQSTFLSPPIPLGNITVK